MEQSPSSLADSFSGCQLLLTIKIWMFITVFTKAIR
jgi:hypothetical protein